MTMMDKMLGRFVSPTVLTGLRNSLYLYIGTVVNQLIAFVGFLFIVRMLGPSDYGVYATVGAFVGMFNFVILTGLDKVVVREGSKDPPNMGRVLEGTVGIRNLFVLVGVASCVALGLAFPYPWETKLYIVLFSSSLAFNGLNNFIHNIYLSFERMEYVAFINVFQSAFFVVLSIACLHLGLGLPALYVVAMASFAVTLLANHRTSRRFVVFDFLSRPRFDAGTLRSALVFSLISFTVYLYTTVDVLMISLFGSATDVAHYSVPYVIFAQGTVALNMMATAFFPIFVRSLQRPMERKRFLSYSFKMPIVSLVIFVPAFVFAEDIITLLFGSEYQSSGELLRLLVCLWPIRFFGMPFSSALQATNNESYLLYMIVPRAVLNIVLNYVFYFEWGLLGIVYSTLVTIGIGIPVTNVIAYRFLTNRKILV